MNLENMLEEIEARVNADASKRSDDFGHDTDALLVFESQALAYHCDNTIPKLVAALRLAIEQRDWWLSEYLENFNGEDFEELEARENVKISKLLQPNDSEVK